MKAATQQHRKNKQDIAKKRTTGLELDSLGVEDGSEQGEGGHVEGGDLHGGEVVHVVLVGPLRLTWPQTPTTTRRTPPEGFRVFQARMYTHTTPERFHFRERRVRGVPR